MKNYDYLVIGSGIAGLVFALETSKWGKVAVVTKKEITACNTDYAQGGIAAVLSDHDTFEEHINDTYIAGAKLGKKGVMEKIIKEGPDVIQYLLDLGTKFTVDNNSPKLGIENLRLTKEGGHSHHRVVYGADSTGHLIMEALIDNCRNSDNIDIYENHMAVDLITQHHIPQLEEFITRISCWGAYVMDCETNNIEIFKAKKTMLATGGGSQVYSHNTNPDIATGDGIAMARLAGARLANMEFIQFHPTAFYSPAGKTFLISEALRGEGAILKTIDGEEFMENYHEQGCLAPRDIVSRSIDTEMTRRSDKHVYLDATHLDSEMLKNHFPYIDKKCRKFGIDFTKQPIPVAPAAHYFCGGIMTTADGETDIRNLYAAGEVACTGLHGANRLASNSLLEAAVIAFNAAHSRKIKEEIRFPEIPEWKDLGSFNETEWVIISHNREIIGRIMQGYVGIRRTRRLLNYALSRLENIYTEINNFYSHNSVRKEVIETRNLAVIAIMIIRSALARKESRGAHFVVDYPDNDANYLKDTII